MIKNINKYELMEVTGYPKTQAQRLIREAKNLMVEDGFTWYAVNVYLECQFKRLSVF